MISQQTSPERPVPSVQRRTLLRTAAWAAPMAVLATTAPAFAAPACVPTSATWAATSRIVYTATDYSNVNFDQTVTAASTPPGAMSVQHWGSGTAADTLNWRIPLGFPQGAAAGAVLTIPYDASWTGAVSAPGYFGNVKFQAFGAETPNSCTLDLPKGTSVVVNTKAAAGQPAITITFPEIPAGSAGGYSFTVKALGGGTAVKSGATFVGQATLSFTPLSC